ncbi:DsbA family oxidoreductase [Massilia cavernae]|uniref:DsbA family oxidoreductase n=1 Tax=Massilia cavernae TaxID=2320864 RepID=A0A418Y7R0_9BURK|nr:DsbA family oxidoreductase [Massilia cavernae]RJG27178.1 DsbA family oxidoreductase [Massilia cavernae]
MTRQLQVEVKFDFICPWCLIGQRQLNRALAALRAEQPGMAVQVHWRGVQLLPDVPAAGLPFVEFYKRRLGSEAAMRQRQEQVLRAAEAAGGRVDYSAIAIMPNTADAHRLLAHASRHGTVAQRDALLERLFRAYFEQGEDLGNSEVLLAHGVACGFERAALRRELRGARVPFVAYGAGDGNSGVPLFTFDARLTLSGARPHDVLLGAMRHALATAPASV